MTLFHLFILGIVQGITEFLPISSSAHLILVPQLMGEADQGLLVDVGAHAGTLLAVMIFFRRDVIEIVKGAWETVLRKPTQRAKLTQYLIVGTIPGALAGFLLMDYQEVLLRHVWIIVVTSIVWGIALWLVDKKMPQEKTVDRDLDWKTVVFVGLAQALALIPGTSRSGITMTAARFRHFSRTEAARFSFLLSMPVTGAAVLIMLLKIVKGEADGEHLHAFFVVGGVSFVTAIFAIWFLMRWLRTHNFTPFVIYRLFLAAFLIFWLL